MINEHCRIYKVICIYKFSAILKILKSARRTEAPLAVTSHLGHSIHVFSRACFRTTGTRLLVGVTLQVSPASLEPKILYDILGYCMIS
jgi:hypothetical protein